MGFNANYDKAHCHTVVDVGAGANSLAEEVSKALSDFYDAVNAYFSNGIDNYSKGYYFNFSFIHVGNDVEDDDPDVSAMIQYTSRDKDPQDIHLHVAGGKDSKYLTTELILPAYTYLLTKCSKMGFAVHESSHRRCGAPIYIVPERNAVQVQCPGADELYWVTDRESPKLNDKVKSLAEVKNNGVGKTNIFG